MIRVSITKKGILTNQASFPTEELASNWFAQERQNQSFGKNQGIYLESELTEEEKASGTIVPSEEDNLVPENQWQIPDQYDHVFEDISEEVEQEKTNIEALEFLSRTDWKVLRHIRELALGLATSLTEAEYLALEEERAAAAALVVLL